MPGLRNLLLTRTGTAVRSATQQVNVIKSHGTNENVHNLETPTLIPLLIKLPGHLLLHPHPLLETEGSAKNARIAGILVTRSMSVERKGGKKLARETRRRPRTPARLRG